MKLHERPVDGRKSKFVITEGRACFVPYLGGTDAPKMVDILGEIFDLDDPEVFGEVDGKLVGGRIILGHYDPSTKEVVVSTPLEPSKYVEGKIEEVFGDA